MYFSINPSLDRPGDVWPGSGVSLQYLLEHLFIHGQILHQMLQTSVLFSHLFEVFGFIDFHSTTFFTSAIIGVGNDLSFSTGFLNGFSLRLFHLHLAENGYNLLSCMSLTWHRCPLCESILKFLWLYFWTIFWGADHLASLFRMNQRNFWSRKIHVEFMAS